MALTPAQRKILESYQLFRDTPPSVWRQWQIVSRSHAMLMILVALASIILYLEVSPSAGCYLAGFGIGAVVRDFGWFRATARVWPVLSQVVHWQKVDDLLEGREDLESEV